GLCYQPALPDELAGALTERDQRPDDLEPRFLAALEAGRRDDVLRGVTRIGPHRDDVQFTLDAHPAPDPASRGQLHTAPAALRLAEVALSTSRTGEPPVLLLDDILSELDPHRRERVLAVATGVDQVLITTPDADRPSATELPDARRFTLEGGA